MGPFYKSHLKFMCFFELGVTNVVCPHGSPHSELERMLARDGSLGLATMSGWSRFAFSALRDALLRPGAPEAAMARTVTGPRVAVAPASGP